MTVSRSIIITDPVHQVMSFGTDEKVRKLLKGVIDTPTFQRLRRISQLGLAQNVFPGATHTRFVHGLGAAYLASKALTHLEERHGPESVKDHRREVIAAALLHDVGHGPFSHSFEHVFDSMGIKAKVPAHEDWTRAAIELDQSDIHGALNDARVDIARTATAFQRNGGDGPLPKFLRQLVSSQLDVDRMDYLVRDSHFAGVALGRVDIYYLIQCLTRIEHDGQQLFSLGIEEKGIKAYEGFALARQLMNRTVYYHKAVKVFEFMMEECLRQVIHEHDVLETIPECRSSIPSYLTSIASIKYSPPASLDAFMASNWKQYASLSEPDIWCLIRNLAESTSTKVPKRLSRLSRMLLAREKLRYWVVLPGMTPILRDKLSKAGFIDGNDCALIDFRTTVYKQDKDPIFVTFGRDRVAEIATRSDILGMLRDREEKVTLLIALNEEKASTIYESAKSVRSITEEESA